MAGHHAPGADVGMSANRRPTRIALNSRRHRNGENNRTRERHIKVFRCTVNKKQTDVCITCRLICSDRDSLLIVYLVPEFESFDPVGAFN